MPTKKSAALRRAHSRAFAKELRLVDKIHPGSTKAQIDRALAAAEATNRARRAFQIAELEEESQ
jgi:hypothetical protein